MPCLPDESNHSGDQDIQRRHHFARKGGEKSGRIGLAVLPATVFLPLSKRKWIPYTPTPRLDSNRIGVNAHKRLMPAHAIFFFPSENSTHIHA